MRIFLTIIFTLVTTLAHAQSFPESNTPFVNDFADIISPEVEERITQDLQKLRNDDSIEMTVVTINSTSKYEGTPMDVPAFTTALFNKWGVGDSEKNNGILMLIAVDDREAFIGLGSSYPSSYDDRMDRVFDQYMKSNFQAGAYSEGIEAGVLEVINRTQENWAPQKKRNILSKLLLPFIFIGFVFIALRKTIGDWTARLKRCPKCNQRGLSRHRHTTQEPTVGTKGIETTSVICQNCDHREDTDRILSVRQQNRSGGGFGGGGSSGGGGGGKW